MHDDPAEASLRLLQLQNMKLLARRRRPGAAPTFTEWAQMWAETRLVTVETLDHYKSDLHKHLSPAVGHLHLEQIDHETVRDLAATLVQAGLAPRTVRHIVTLLGTLLRDAIRIGFIVHDPTRGILMRRYEVPRPRITSEQLAEIASRMPTPALHALVITTAYTGLRPGEVAALQRKNHRHDDPRALGLPYLYIHPTEGSRHEHRGRRWLGTLKNQASVRHVFLPPFLDSLLDTDLGSTRQLLFSRPDGDLLSRRDINAPWRQACDGAEDSGWDPVCPALRLYDLRHLHRTWMDEDQINEDVQAARLGHKRAHRRRPPLNVLAASQQPLLTALERRRFATNGV
ncbi:tyrosine-type recombinase/integrase [Catellatospora citrea]|uniref:tyrosine-type recombinase/integrase n=1 Tax=Catellatospora citrea TaxID=53366 RepID=UPI0034101618